MQSGFAANRSTESSNYYIAPAIDVKVVFKAELMLGITTTKARPVAAAIRPYSIAVAPDWSLRNLNM